jgi:crotonobetainyl-CoA:carnitine CoA-transferase CaiB-like acyl-CoA transferase
MATEQRFWRNFCNAVDRVDLLERWPGSGYMDHEYGNVALRDELARLFATRKRAEWVQLFIDQDVAGAPVYEPGETYSDPHFAARRLWLDPELDGIGLLGSPVRVDGHQQRPTRPAPGPGQDSRHVLGQILGYDEQRIDAVLDGDRGDRR